MSLAEQKKNITIEIAQSYKKINPNQNKLKKLIRAICDRFNLLSATVSIAIVSDSEIRKLNNQFLNYNSTTDCLSFDLSDNENRKSKIVNHKSFELVVNAEKAIREANCRGHSSEAELALYITHGLLHNLGFDDSEPRQAQKMHDTEDEILLKSGYGRVYNPDVIKSKLF